MSWNHHTLQINNDTIDWYPFYSNERAIFVNDGRDILSVSLSFQFREHNIFQEWLRSVYSDKCEE